MEFAPFGPCQIQVSGAPLVQQGEPAADRRPTAAKSLTISLPDFH
jgi:hypothetical protein